MPRGSPFFFKASVFRLLIGVLVFSALSGCAMKLGFENPFSSASDAAKSSSSEKKDILVMPVRLRAIGHGNTASYSQYTHGQQKLMAMRAAQVDAYRNLAEQVNGFRVWGNTAVSAFSTQSDSVRVYVDAFVRGARVVNTMAIADNNYEVTVELEVTQEFMRCFSPESTCFTPPATTTATTTAPVSATTGSACVTVGCTASSIQYVTH